MTVTNPQKQSAENIKAPMLAATKLTELLGTMEERFTQIAGQKPKNDPARIREGENKQ
jgi:hypothetical protein